MFRERFHTLLEHVGSQFHDALGAWSNDLMEVADPLTDIEEIRVLLDGAQTDLKTIHVAFKNFLEALGTDAVVDVCDLTREFPYVRKGATV